MVSVSDAINSPRLPSIKAIMGAKKKPLDRLALADTDLDAGRVGADGARSVVRSVAPVARPRESRSRTPAVTRRIRWLQILAERGLV